MDAFNVVAITVRQEATVHFLESTRETVTFARCTDDGVLEWSGLCMSTVTK